VFNHGRIEQVGTPADVYERPASPFVAGFVGTSNLIDGPTAKALLGREGTFTVRPEKIRLAEPGATILDGDVVADGTIRDVQYLGADTRYVVTLDVGGELVVTQQNLSTTSMDALARRGQRVRLLWEAAHATSVAASAPTTDAVPVTT